jgi:hypothetical protein
MHLAGPVDIAVFVFKLHGCQTFRKRLGIIISRRNNLPARFIHVAQFIFLLHAGQSFGEGQCFVKITQPFYTFRLPRLNYHFTRPINIAILV